MKKKKFKRIIFFETDFFFRFYLKKLFREFKDNIVFMNRIPKNSDADVFVIPSSLLDGFLKDETEQSYLIILNRETNKFDLVSKFSSPKKLYKAVLRAFN